MIPVTIVIMTKNEELNIEKCIKSVHDFDEIFVVDSNSNDNTVIIAEKMGAKVVNFTWNGAYPKKKQWCLENLGIQNEWIMYVDADEEVPGLLVNEIKEAIAKNSSINGYYVKYDYYFMNTRLRYGHKIYKLILFKHAFGKFLEYDDIDIENMWEVEGHYQPEVSGNIEKLSTVMIHNDKELLFHYFDKLNKYSDWEAGIKHKNVRRHSENNSAMFFRKIIQKTADKVPFKGFLVFFYSYIFKLGFLDGAPGYHYAMSLWIYFKMTHMKTIELKKNHS